MCVCMCVRAHTAMSGCRDAWGRWVGAGVDMHMCVCVCVRRRICLCRSVCVSGTVYVLKGGGVCQVWHCIPKLQILKSFI